MTTTKTVRPPNSIVFLMDPESGIVPNLEGPHPSPWVVATPSCVAIGTLCEMDGDTNITLGDETPGPTAGPPALDRTLASPNGRLAVCSSHDEVLVDVPTPAPRCRVRIWMDDPSEPENIWITISAPPVAVVDSGPVPRGGPA